MTHLVERQMQRPRLRVPCVEARTLRARTACLLVLGVLSQGQPVLARGVVGKGTQESCDALALDKALAGGGKVTFNCGPAPVTITVTSNRIVAANTTIDGGGLVTVSGDGTMAVFAVHPAVTLTLANLSVINGTADRGAGVFNEGRLRVQNCIFANNNAGTVGGAIFNDGTVTVSKSTFSDNVAMGGGGIYNAGTLTVTDSTFTDNSTSGIGGGIATFMGKVKVLRTTFAYNDATDVGGGIYNEGLLTVVNSTFFGNHVEGFGAAIATVGGMLTLTNTTLARNSADALVGGILAWDSSLGDTVILQNTIVANNAGGNCGGAIVDGGNNLQFPGNDCGPGIRSANPKLAPDGLGNNGGLTQTIALLAQSPAINAGNAAICRTGLIAGIDQRSFVRPGIANVNCSIGAYEFNSRAR
jgi:parallel beta helix pectate lyase-like protein